MNVLFFAKNINTITLYTECNRQRYLQVLLETSDNTSYSQVKCRGPLATRDCPQGSVCVDDLRGGGTCCFGKPDPAEKPGTCPAVNSAVGSEDRCSRFICYNGGYCISRYDYPPTCVCPPDFTGRRCEKKLTTVRCPAKEKNGFVIDEGKECRDDLSCADDHICCNFATGRRCTYVPNHLELLYNPTCGGCPVPEDCMKIGKKYRCVILE
ncbi:neurogenic locus notch homolog protein 1-like [Physella acuta]|uniref:neurogenic locus notch homolog protein 1-like n=1 Tax=Physella acuta TaxID=109671 RepID=UPI0027DDFC1D|nr:neurogenic locus notch homolog protein 1-like [Physella acuta]